MRISFLTVLACLTLGGCYDAQNLYGYRDDYRAYPDSTHGQYRHHHRDRYWHDHGDYRSDYYNHDRFDRRWDDRYRR